MRDETVMMKIALCDDEPAVREEVRSFLEQYRTQRKRDLEAVTFRGPLEMLAAMERGAQFDILLLDILMPGQDGIETAAEIRKFDSNVKIVFLTSSPEYAVQSYAVNAFYYLLKPLQTESFFPLLDSIFETYEREQSSSLLLRCRDRILRVYINQIEFCEVIHRTLFIHLVSGEVLESVGSLNKLEKQLAGYGCFLRFHRSYLVNLDYVHSISHRAVVMSSQTEIPVPRGKYEEIKNAFLENAFRIGGKTRL